MVSTIVAAAVSMPVIASAAQALGRVETGERAPDFDLPGADRGRHSLADHEGEIIVLEWTNPVCPYTEKKYDSGEMQALQEFADDHDIVWYSVNTTGRPDRPGFLSASEARERIAATGAEVDAFLLDTDARVGRMYGARTTPSFFIIGKDGAVAYQGAMDDDVYANGNVTKNYVQEAMNALLAGREPETRTTRPYGCAVEY